MKKLDYILLLLGLLLFYGCTTTEQVVDQYLSGTQHKALATSLDGKAAASWGHPTAKSAMAKAIVLCIDANGVGCKIVSVNGSKKNVSYNQSTQTLSPAGESSTQAVIYNCSELTEGRAYLLLYEGHSYLDRDDDGHPCEWGQNSNNSVPTYSTPATYRSGNCHWVKGYRRRNGTYVRRHRRCR